MKIFTKVLSCLYCCFLILTVGCAAEINFPTEDQEMLLEIYTDASESIDPPGKTLDLRVYDDGRTEFDHFWKESKMEPLSSKLKQTSINSEQVAEIRSILKDLDSENPKSTYQPVMRSIDSSIVVTIKYKSKEGMKSISLNENDSHLHLDEKSDIYPTSLIKLLKLNYRLGVLVRKEAK